MIEKKVKNGPIRKFFGPLVWNWSVILILGPDFPVHFAVRTLFLDPKSLSFGPKFCIPDRTGIADYVCYLRTSNPWTRFG